jgi:hypothetical protein
MVLPPMGVPTVTTITAIMKRRLAATFGPRLLASVVRKKLGLNLTSKKVDGKRVYRIVGGGARSAPARKGSRAS